MKYLPITIRKDENGTWYATYECCSAVGSSKREAEILLYELIDYAFKELLEENREFKKNA